ncbi:cytochrome d ubiquinol oxidase subunit II [Haloarculaceae archaeon H-GB2-1]|nr:cytochrome d ubiquinol oxidase subunit II [Haloarculaceae archaeon H-GB1-1]MEA5386342.1 cytochrome d ubiquinol oxidase subunit II [Haloarculaceae archaeon H-GB11]MEA5407843.1 cytochrome d ubiquinol oxidase subunit II [Haloarculaceae archaeon H-GB2-1]
MIEPALSLATRPLFGLPLAELWFAVLLFVLGMFVFLDGFDFGVGALFATREDEHERETLLSAIGPFWDGNEVWLVVFGGALFAVFPQAYAGLFSRYYLLMFAILGALILRGIAPELYEQRDDDAWHRLWGTSFVVGSVGSPFFLGWFVGNWVTGQPGVVSLAGPVFGLATLALSVVLGAAFLGLKTRGSLRDDVAADGQRAAVAYLALAVVALVYLALAFEWGLAAVLSLPSIAAVGLTVASLAGYVLATRRERYHVAFASTATTVLALVLLVGSLLYPAIDPAGDLTVQAGAVETLSLNLVTIASAFLIPMVLGYFGVLYSVFAGPVEAGEAY